jgi:single-strand selective monofunctional uracil DNA glycosylase
MPNRGSTRATTPWTGTPVRTGSRSASASATELAAALAGKVARLRFEGPAHVYNPLRYAWPLASSYLERFGAARGRVLLVGMNPGPWGMMQTGVPFGDPIAVRDWMGLVGEVRAPTVTHPRVPVRGLGSTRREGSGSRLWGWAEARFGAADAFFARAFVWNWCPLGFLDDKGTNLTPDALRREQRDRLGAICDDALRGLIERLAPRAVVGVGGFAEGRIRGLALGDDLPVHRLLHPSPANPRANKGWAAEADRLADALAM